MRKNSADWLYRLEKNFVWDSNFPVPEDLIFKDSAGNVRLIIETDGKITVTRGYCWNGCSPKFDAFDLVLGTPDGVTHAITGHPKTYDASLIHDALYQFLKTDAPYSRKEADACFLQLMTTSDFALRYLYWAVVRVFGWLFWHGMNYKRKWHGRCLPKSALM